ncbi:c-type cytochrome [Elioraea sp. Yellowstone]|jgi:mono/diheme cytochrome c family protein|uniref:c-type cytochrome n=1 Tax=Elioraea sp. Yellowstone TaxID=2592070 RepID=UPI001386747F|nr:c-type cytochrome [Elioraea sp. Yellowstone]
MNGVLVLAGVLLAGGVAMLAARGVPQALAASSQVERGRAVYAEACAVCHGEDGRGGAGFGNPIWGEGAQIRKFRHGAGLLEYNLTLMPFDDPTRVSDDDKLAVTAYILARHGAMAEGATLSEAEAAAIAIR